MKREVGKAILASAGLVADEAALSVTAGAVSGRAHVASTAPNPPNADTHTLDRSIHAEKTGDLTAIAVADADHAVPQEFGTSRLEARPFMAPAARKKGPDAARLVSAAANRVVNGGNL